MLEDPRDDEQLITEVARGDTTALTVLIRRHQSRILSFAYRMLGDWDQAEDVAQEVFIRIYRSAGRYHGKSRFTTWLYRVVVNLCLDHRRRQRPSVPIEDLDSTIESTRTPDPLVQDETAVAIRQAISELNERQRTVILLHRFEGQTHAQISEITGWSQSAVESLLVRAYDSLRKKLKKIAETGQ